MNYRKKMYFLSVIIVVGYSEVRKCYCPRRVSFPSLQFNDYTTFVGLDCYCFAQPKVLITSCCSLLQGLIAWQMLWLSIELYLDLSSTSACLYYHCLKSSLLWPSCQELPVFQVPLLAHLATSLQHWHIYSTQRSCNISQQDLCNFVSVYLVSHLYA